MNTNKHIRPKCISNKVFFIGHYANKLGNNLDSIQPVGMKKFILNHQYFVLKISLFHKLFDDAK